MVTKRWLLSNQIHIQLKADSKSQSNLISQCNMDAVSNALGKRINANMSYT